jgi:hypothetical protein
MPLINEAYVQEDRHKTGVCVDKPVEQRTPSKFASWDRRNLEDLAEKLVAELNETKGELALALKFWRKEVQKNKDAGHG